MADTPPMCPGSWLLGNARALLDDTAGTLTTARARLGPMFRIRAAWREYTVIAGPEASEFMAQGLDKRHLSRERLFGSVAREFGRADLILKEIGPRHARLRAALALAYSRQVASPHVPRLVEAVRAEVRRWPQAAKLGVVRHAKALAFEQYRVLLGSPPIAFGDCLLMTDYLMNVGARLLPSLVFSMPWYRRAHRRTYGAITDAARRARDEGPAGGPPTVIDALWKVRDSSGTALTEPEVVGYAAYGVGASIGYVGRLTAFLLYELLRDADLYRQVDAEVRAAFETGLATAADVRRMPILRSVYDETLRCHPFATGLAFDVASPFEFLGHRVERDAYLVLSPVPSSFSPAAFPDPHRFDPARCRDPRNEHRRSQACLPFGLGDRTCAAMGLVELLTMTIVATVLHERALALDPPHYRLRQTVSPLPSPDRRFGMRLGPPRPDVPPPEDAARSEEDVLSTFPGHDVAAVRDALAAAPLRACPAGAVIVREGDDADAFYLVETGRVEVTRRAATGTQHLGTLAEGEWFGEAGLLLNAPRNATVTAGADGAAVRVLDRQAFLSLIEASDLVADEIGRLMRKRLAETRLRQALPLLGDAAAERLLPDFKARTWSAGTPVVREGEPADEFFVVMRGEAVVTRRDPSGATVTVARLGPGDYFGETGLLHGAPRNATVAASGAQDLEVLVTGRDGFDRLIAEGGGRGGELAGAMLARLRRLS